MKFLQLLCTPVGGHVVEFFPVLRKTAHSRCDLVLHEVRLVGKTSASLLYGLNGSLVAAKLSFETLVLLAQVLHASQIATVVVRTHQKLLLAARKEIKLHEIIQL